MHHLRHDAAWLRFIYEADIFFVPAMYHVNSRYMEYTNKQNRPKAIILWN